ncbi:inorganic phosphate transporter [Micrococcus sp. GPGPB33]|uniref:inorganic phosphate transporter n=1 Tax=Micrococcus sp. GPGPB33 TaxID=3023084 RepID=UPI0030BAD65F
MRLDPLRASVAAVIPAGLLFVGSLVFHLPLSSTHTATAAIVGAGQTQTYASVRWPTVLRVVGWWLLTPVACALLGLLGTLALLPLA